MQMHMLGDNLTDSSHRSVRSRSENPWAYIRTHWAEHSLPPLLHAGIGDTLAPLCFFTAWLLINSSWAGCTLWIIFKIISYPYCPSREFWQGGSKRTLGSQHCGTWVMPPLATLVSQIVAAPLPIQFPTNVSGKAEDSPSTGVPAPTWNYGS